MTKQKGAEGDKAMRFERVAIERLMAGANGRTALNKVALNELIESVKQHGVLEPLLVKPAKGNKYEVVAGHRRLQAATKAKLADVPVMVMAADAPTREIQLIENLQREDLPPLDEAAQYDALYAELAQAAIRAGQPGGPRFIAEAARRVGKDEKYVRVRLSLLKLIPAARKGLASGVLTLGHGIELARLDPGVQAAALKQCFRSEEQYDPIEHKWVKLKANDPGRVTSVAHLQEWVRRNVMVKLSEASWDLADAGLVPEAGACLDCPYRSGTDSGVLFQDVKRDDICTKPVCYQSKQAALIARQAEAVKTNTGREPVFIATGYVPYGTQVPKGTLGTDGYRAVGNDAKACNFTEPAVVAYAGEGKKRQDVGGVTYICREGSCPVHNKQETADGLLHGGKLAPDAGKKFSARKQELFDQKVREEARRRVLGEASHKVKKLPFSRAQLDRIAERAFRNLQPHSRELVIKLAGWWPGDALPDDPEEMATEIPKLSASRLPVFMMLCASIDYHDGDLVWIMKGGKGTKTEKRDWVADYAKEYKVNLPLHDANVRLELGAKKHKAAHEAYLKDVIKRGAKAVRPEVFEASRQEKMAAEKAAAKKQKAKTKAA